MADELDIIVRGQDLASAALRSVEATAKTAMASVAGAAQNAQAGLTSAGNAAGQALGKIGTGARAAAQQHGAAFGEMKGHLSGYRAELGVGSLALAGFVGAAVMGIGSLTRAAEESEEASIKLAVAVRNAGTGISTAGLETQANALQKITRFDDEAIKGAQSYLVAARLTEAQVRQLTPALTDLAEFMGKDIEGAAKALAYALETGNVQAFKRLKIVVNEAKFALDPMGALMEAIEKKAGGMAEAIGKTAGGQLAIMSHQFDELKEQVGTALLPALTDLAKGALPVADALGRIADSKIGKWALDVAIPVTAVAVAIKGLQMAAGLVSGAWVALMGGWTALAARLGLSSATATTAAAAQTAAGAAAAAAGAQAAAAALGWNANAAAMGRTLIAGGGAGAVGLAGRTLIAGGAIGAAGQAGAGAVQQVGGGVIGGGILARAGGFLGRGIGLARAGLGRVGGLGGSTVGAVAAPIAAAVAIGYAGRELILNPMVESDIRETEAVGIGEGAAPGASYQRRKQSLYQALLGGRELDSLSREEQALYYGTPTPGARNVPGMRGGMYQGFSPEMRAAVAQAQMARSYAGGIGRGGWPAELTTPGPAVEGSTGPLPTAAELAMEAMPGGDALRELRYRGGPRPLLGKGKSGGGVTVTDLKEAAGGDVEMTIRWSREEPSVGVLDAATSEYLDDLAYAGPGAY